MCALPQFSLKRIWQGSGRGVSFFLYPRVSLETRALWLLSGRFLPGAHAGALKTHPGVLALTSRIRECDLWTKGTLQRSVRVWVWRWSLTTRVTARALLSGRQEGRGEVRVGTHARLRREGAGFEDRGSVLQPGVLAASRSRKRQQTASPPSPPPPQACSPAAHSGLWSLEPKILNPCGFKQLHSWSFLPAAGEKWIQSSNIISLPSMDRTLLLSPDITSVHLSVCPSLQDPSDIHTLYPGPPGLVPCPHSPRASPGAWCKEPTHLKTPWCWERLMAGGDGDSRGWDGWMAPVVMSLSKLWETEKDREA